MESVFKSRVTSDLDKIDGLFYFIKEALALRGIPDIIGCYKGRFFAWELKRSEKESTTTGRAALQRYIIEKIRKAGGIGEFVSPENYEAKFREVTSLK